MKERNRSIDIFRYICAILVVAIHICPGQEINKTMGYILNEVLTRVAVPFFLVVAGYYYIKALENGKRIFLSYLLRILKIYAFWSAIYFAVDFVLWGQVDVIDFLKKSVYAFFVTGSHYHFWYFPALIVSVCWTTVIYKIRLQKLMIPLSLILYTIGCLGCSYYAIGVKIPVFSALISSAQFTYIRRVLLMAVPLFTAGLLVNKIEKYIQKHDISQTSISVALIAAVIVWLLEIIMVITFRLQESIIITFGLYVLTVAIMVFLLRHPMPKAKRISQKCHFLADFTYYSHPLIITIITLSTQIFGKPNIPQTLVFFIVIGVTWVLGTVFYYLLKKKHSQI